MQTPTEVHPFGLLRRQAGLIALGDDHILRNQERARPHGALGLVDGAPVHLGRALEQHRRVQLHALVGAYRVVKDDIQFAQKKIRKNDGVRRATTEHLVGFFLSVAGLHGRDVVRQFRCRHPAEPLERNAALAVRDAKVDFHVAVAPVPHNRLAPALDQVDGLRVGGLHERRMRELDVITVAVVLGQHFPVGLEPVFQPAGGQLQLAFRRQIGAAVQQFRGPTQMLGQRHARVVQAGEHEAAIHLHLGGRHHAMRRLLEVGAVAIRLRRIQKTAIQVVHPAVIRTCKHFVVAGVACADLVATVGAAVANDVHAPVLAARHDDRLLADLPGDVVAGIGNLAVVADEHPAVVEDLFHLLVEDGRVRVQRAVYPIWLDEQVVIDRNCPFDAHRQPPVHERSFLCRRRQAPPGLAASARGHADHSATRRR